MLPDLSQMSGIGVRYTDHSLRATAIAIIMGIPEKIIAETSVHRSTKALRFYELTNAEQQQAVTAIINSAVGKEVEKKVSERTVSDNVGLYTCVIGGGHIKLLDM